MSTPGRREIEGEGLDAIIITASGCGTTIKDYGFMLRVDPAYAEKAREVSALTKDITEYLVDAGACASRLNAAGPDGRLSFRLFHAAWPEDHRQPKDTAGKGAGFDGQGYRAKGICAAARPAPTISFSRRFRAQLRDRKIANIEATGPDLIATGNIGCMTQIGGGTDIPVVHTAELLDWAYGGPEPKAMSGMIAAAGVAGKRT